jgi:formiminoglutamase
VTPVEVLHGDGPVVIGLPHAGTHVPPEIGVLLNRRGRALADTDWHVDRLWAGLLPGATVVRATFHRYVIDANRPPDGASLYPGQNTTGLVPATDFDGLPIWDRPIGPGEVAARIAAFHAPYHAALTAEMMRVRAAHGVAILVDAHSIRSRIPFLFDGVLPDLNLGTADGTSCAPALATAAAAVCAAAPGLTHVVNGRFKGGWTTRHYGRPAAGWHALQMEIAQSAYLAAEAPPWPYDPARAGPLREVLAALLAALAALAPALKEVP